MVDVDAEDAAICQLIEANPNEAYERARTNLARARQTRNDKLIMRCALSLGYSAASYRPSPKLEDAVEAYLLAAQKALATDDSKTYAAAQFNLGSAYARLSTGDSTENLRKAIACFENMLKVYSEQHYPHEYATIQQNLGTAYSDLPTGDQTGNLRKAITCIENALTIHTEQDYPQDYAAAQNSLGNAYARLPTGDPTENLRQAIACFENALKGYSQQNYPQEYATIQNNLGAAYSDLPTGDQTGNLQHSIACYKEALRVYTKKDNPNAYALINNNMGNVYSKLPTGNRTDNLKNAITCYNNSLRIYTPCSHPQYYAMLQNNLGAAYSKLFIVDGAENIGKAIACYKNALTVYREADYPQEYAMTQNNLGAAYAGLPTGDRAENLRNTITCYNNSLKVYRETDYPRHYAMIQNNIGVAYFKLSTGDRAENLRNAITCYKKALRVYREADYPQEYAMTQDNLGNAYSNLPTGNKKYNLASAIEYYNKALAVYTETVYPLNYASTQNNMGTVYARMSSENRVEHLYLAIKCYNNALKVYKPTKYSQDYAKTQNNLGAAYAELPIEDSTDNLTRAIVCYEQALAVYCKEDYPQQFAMTQHNIGIAYYKFPAGDSPKNLRNAITYYENALRVFDEQFPQNRVDTLYLLALASDDALEDRQRSYHACAEAIEILEKHVRAVSSTETRRAVAETQARIYHHMVSLCVRLGKPADALSYAERGKSRTLVEMLHSAQLPPSEKVPRETRDTFVAVRAKRKELDYLRQADESLIPRNFEVGKDAEQKVVFRTISVTDSSPREDISRLHEEIQRAYDSLLEEIRRLDPEFAASEQVQPLCVSDIEALIPERTLFVECFTGYDGTYVFVLDGKRDIGNTHLLLKDLTYAELLNDIVLEKWLNPYVSLKNEQTGAHEHAWLHAIESTPRLLAEKFWHGIDEEGKSLAKLVEQSGAERIVFFPHSGLHLLPLHLMPVSKDDPEPRLMDRYEVVYAPSASMLRLALNRPQHLPERLIAVANPDHSLNFAENEIELISSHFDRHQILRHEEATKEALLSRAPQANVVHFSCHGSFKDENPLDSHLALAGENLSLGEIFSKLKLPRAGVVVLPACETGMVKLEQGDEYIGLASGFLHAGALSVISSLWAVDDFSTSLLMQRWYENVLKHKRGKAAALREAQQWVRRLKAIDIRPFIDTIIERTQKQPQADKEKVLFLKIRRKIYRDMPDDEHPFAHPYYWGGFVCTGNWN